MGRYHMVLLVMREIRGFKKKSSGSVHCYQMIRCLIYPPIKYEQLTPHGRTATHVTAATTSLKRTRCPRTISIVPPNPPRGNPAGLFIANIICVDLVSYNYWYHHSDHYLHHHHYHYHYQYEIQHRNRILYRHIVK